MQSFNKRSFAFVKMVGKGGGDGTHGDGNAEFGSPVGVAVDASDAGLLYVVDNTNHRIQASQMLYKCRKPFFDQLFLVGHSNGAHCMV